MLKKRKKMKYRVGTAIITEVLIYTKLISTNHYINKNFVRLDVDCDPLLALGKLIF